MTESPVLVSQLQIRLDGEPLPNTVINKLLSVRVDQQTHLPDMFTLRLTDPNLDLLDKGPFALTKGIDVLAETAVGERFPLIKGEITALEPIFEAGMTAELLVSGYDPTHRLYRETKSCTYLNQKDSDIAQEIASKLGLKANIEETAIVYDHIYQDNQSDFAFLRQRAWRIGYTCFVHEDTLHFHKPQTEGDPVTLKWGEDLLSFQPRMTLTEQVDEVLVKGWDSEKQTPLVGQAEAGNGRLYPHIAQAENGAILSRPFGTSRRIYVDMPVTSQEEANLLAAARLDEMSGTFITARGVAFRRPDIRAGHPISLENLGERLSGIYLVTRATHQYSSRGLETSFFINGSRLALLHSDRVGKRPLRRWLGVVTAVITNTDDPKDGGRVKMKYPWLTEEHESDWARVSCPGAGPNAGLFSIPEVGDEVLVTFEHGDINRPFVLGGLWHGEHKLPDEALAAANGQKPRVHTWRSRTGHHFTIYDTEENRVEIITADGHQLCLNDKEKKITFKSQNAHQLTFNDADNKIVLASDGGHIVALDDQQNEISVQSSGTLQIKAATNMTIKTKGNLELAADGQVTIQGQMVNIN